MKALAPVLLALASPALAGCDAAARPVAVAEEASAEPLALTGSVVDAARILDEATEARLARQLSALHEEVGPQVVVVTIPTLDGRDIADFSTDLGNRWGLGDHERDDGLLLVVAPTERKVRIALGVGLEKTLSDELCSEIIEIDILPSYRAGDLVGGTLKGVDRLDAELRSRMKNERAA